MKVFHKGDVGAVIELVITDADTSAAVDISTATEKQIRLQSPNKASITKDAAFTTDGTDGKVRYVSEDNVLVSAGLWRVQAYIELPGRKFSTEIKTFSVIENIV